MSTRRPSLLMLQHEIGNSPTTFKVYWCRDMGSVPFGNIWFTEHSANQVGFFQMNTDTFTEIPIPTAQSSPAGIIVSSPTTVWFTEFDASQVGRIDSTSDTIHEYPTPSLKSRPWSIAKGA